LTYQEFVCCRPERPILYKGAEAFPRLGISKPQGLAYHRFGDSPGNMRFCPGYDSAPTMSGQSTILRGFDAPNDTDGRCCTYSLLGIFNISNPVIYGEGDCTVGRLHSMNHPSSTLTTFLLFHLGELVSTSEPAPLTMMDVYDGASNAARSRVLVRDCPQDDTSAAMLSRCRI